MKDQSIKEGKSKRVYEKPVVESEEIYERTALSCGRDPYLNPLLNIKDSSLACGYSDS